MRNSCLTYRLSADETPGSLASESELSPVHQRDFKTSFMCEFDAYSFYLQLMSYQLMSLVSVKASKCNSFFGFFVFLMNFLIEKNMVCYI